MTPHGDPFTLVGEGMPSCLRAGIEQQVPFDFAQGRLSPRALRVFGMTDCMVGSLWWIGTTGAEAPGLILAVYAALKRRSSTVVPPGLKLTEKETLSQR